MDDSSRKEPFRYVMNQPIDCWLEIPASNSGPGAGKLTEGILLDLSRSGCKVRTSLNLRFTAGDTKLIIHFQLAEEKLQYEGSVRWGWMFGLGTIPVRGKAGPAGRRGRTAPAGAGALDQRKKRSRLIAIPLLNDAHKRKQG